MMGRKKQKPKRRRDSDESNTVTPRNKKSRPKLKSTPDSSRSSALPVHSDSNSDIDLFNGENFIAEKANSPEGITRKYGMEQLSAEAHIPPVSFVQGLSDPSVQKILEQIVSKAVNESINNLISPRLVAMEAKIKDLENSLKERDVKIHRLGEELDELQQYDRRSNLRLMGVPEAPEENTDTVILDMAESIRVPLHLSDISRSHRLGPKKTGASHRPIIFRLISYRVRNALYKSKSKLKSVDSSKLSSVESSEESAPSKLFLNEDLTKLRSQIALRARQLKKDAKITSTWTNDGVIFIRLKNESVRRVTKLSEIDELEGNLRK